MAGSEQDSSTTDEPSSGSLHRGPRAELSLRLAATILTACCALAAPAPDAVCGGCHKAQWEAQARTAMASALLTIAECEILRQHPDLSFSDGVYSYRIVRQGAGSIYRVTDGHETIT